MIFQVVLEPGQETRVKLLKVILEWKKRKLFFWAKEKHKIKSGWLLDPIVMNGFTVTTFERMNEPLNNSIIKKAKKQEHLVWLGQPIRVYG